MRHSLSARIALAGTFVLAGCAATDSEPQATGVAEVQVDPRGDRGDLYRVVVEGALDADAARAQRATGALLLDVRDDRGEVLRASDGTTIRATCGVTFVSRTRAVTASHCVPPSDIRDPATTPVAVQLFDVTAASAESRLAATKLTGSFPSFEHARIEGDGYRVTEIECRVHARCGGSFEPFACPAEIDADIALLECESGLPADREPVEIAATDDEQGPVTMFWFHEVYDVPFIRPEAASPGAAHATELFAHYTALGDMTANFHYFSDGRNQLLPLTSIDWNDHGARRRLGRSGTTVQTDLFGCHGSSGSGIMQRNAATGRFELLGPAATGAAWASQFLCTDVREHRPLVPSLSYTAASFTQAVVALP